MNLAEVDMETFRTQDLEQPAFRLAYSSPVDDDILRMSGTQEPNVDCLFTNSTSFGLDRYVYLFDILVYFYLQHHSRINKMFSV